MLGAAGWASAAPQASLSLGFALRLGRDRPGAVRAVRVGCSGARAYGAVFPIAHQSMIADGFLRRG